MPQNAVWVGRNRLRFYLLLYIIMRRQTPEKCEIMSFIHLITLTSSWKALSTFIGGSLALVSM